MLNKYNAAGAMAGARAHRGEVKNKQKTNKAVCCYAFRKIDETKQNILLTKKKATSCLQANRKKQRMEKKLKRRKKKTELCRLKQ